MSLELENSSCSWNARWLLSPHTDKAARKRAIICKWLQSRRVVMLNETHWFLRDFATWETAFPGARVFAAPAVEGRRGGPKGCVAILLPHGCSLETSRVLVPGYALEVVARRADDSVARFVTAYLLA